MNPDLVMWLDGAATTWWTLVVRTSVDAAVFVTLVGAIGRLFPRIPPRVQCWLWRLVIVRLILTALVPDGVVIRVPVPQVGTGIPLDLAAEPVPPSAAPVIVGRAPGAPVPSPGAPAPARVGVDPVTAGFLAYMALLGAWASVLAVRERSLRRRASSWSPVTSGPWREAYEALCASRGIGRAPLLLSGTDGGPCLHGILQPAIVIPGWQLGEFDRDTARMVLAHELAHHTRGDLFWTPFVLLARGLWFFHPLVRWAANEHDMQQEAACDRHALEWTGSTPVGYGRVLVDSAAGSRTALTLAGIGENGALLERRIRMLARSVSRSGSVTVAARASLVVLGGLLLVPWRGITVEPGTGPRLERIIRNEAWVYDVDFSPDGDTLASADMDGRVILWDVASGRKLKVHQVRGSACDVEFSPDGRWLACASLHIRGRDGSPAEIVVWNPGTDETIRLGSYEGLTSGVHWIDPHRLVVGHGWKEPIRIHDIRTPGSSRELGRNGNYLALTPDRQTLAVRDGNRIEVLPLDGTGPGRWIEVHDEVMQFDFSADGTRLAVAITRWSAQKWSGELEIRDAGSGSLQLSVAGPKGTRSVRCAPRGHLVAAGHSGAITLARMDTRETVAILEGHGADIWSVDFDPDATRLASASADRTVRIWALR